MAKPFFGQGPAPYIARMNMQAATDAGRAYGNAFKNIGSEVGGYLKTYGENKKKGEAADMQIGAILEGMSDERKAEITSGDNPLGKSLEKFIQGELPHSKKEALLGSLVTLDARDRMDRQEQLANTMKQFQLSTMAAQQAQQARQQDGLSQFSQFALGSPEGETNDDFRKRAIEMQKAGKLSPQAMGMVANQFLARRGQEANRDAELEMVKAKALAEAKLTPGQEALDKEFGKSLVDFNEPDVRKGLTQLREASEALGKSDKLTGPWVGSLPNFVGDRINPEGAKVREAVEEVVQRNLRLVLGAAFTQKEGERLINRAFNPALQEEENKKRVERLIQSIESAMNNKISQRSHFQKYGTLAGYNFDAPSVESIEQDAFGDVQKPDGEDPDLLEEEARLKQLLLEREGLFNTPSAQVINAR
jgi:hypothetical protein